ncbi:MAG: hypothetical protein WCJ33_01780 [Pseudomonadota bacterium]
METEIKVCSLSSGSDTDIADIYDYFELRKRVYDSKFDGYLDYYDNYPTKHDIRESTLFLVFKAFDPETNEEVVFGGRRIVFDRSSEANTENDLLPFDGRHKIIRREEANRFKTLIGKDAIDIEDVIPALSTPEDIRYAEFGAFAIDRGISDKFFAKEEYIEFREKSYQKAIDVVKDNDVDIALIDGSSKENNLSNQIEWLKSSKSDFIKLHRTSNLVDGPFPGDAHSELLIVNVSERFYLKGNPESILRFNQKASFEEREKKRREDKELHKHIWTTTFG